MNLQLINTILQICVFVSMALTAIVLMYLFRDILNQNILLHQRIVHLEAQLWKIENENRN